MKKCFLCVVLAMMLGIPVIQLSAQKNAGKAFLIDENFLATSKQKVRSGDKVLTAALAALCKEADAALTDGPYSVMDKQKLPPSGDKHDYMSIGPYWWPDTTKANGLPYIRRDGEVNPERHFVKDADNLKSVGHHVKVMALAYYFTGNKKYSDRSTLLIRTWFLNGDTRMNPNLKYGQAIPGITEGRGIGLIDTKCLVDVIDGIQLLAGSSSWTKKDDIAMKAWMASFLDWMLTSKPGLEEAAEHNNHGVYYDVQTVAIALFLGKEEWARNTLRTVTTSRIESQLKEDGSQPYELARTQSWSYSAMNLKGFFALARLGEHAGFDLWNYKTESGKSLRLAYEWMLPYAAGEKRWTHQQIDDIQWVNFMSMLRMADAHYPNAKAQELMKKWDKESKDVYSRLANTMLY